MPTPANLVHMQSSTTGTGNLTVAAVNGKQAFGTAFGTGATTDVFDYFISNQGAAEWERGTGHMSNSTTLVRDTVLESTNSNAAVSFSAGTKDVVNDVPAAKQVYLDGSGNLDISNRLLRGATSGVALVGSINPFLQNHGTSADTSNMATVRWTNDTSAPAMQQCKSRGTSIGAHAIVQSGDACGSFFWAGSDGTNFITLASIQGLVDGTPGTNDMPGRIQFNTTADGASSASESMRLDNAGAAYFPRISTTASAANAFINNASTPANSLLRSTSSLAYKRDIETLDISYSNNLLNARPVFYRSKCEADNQEWSYWGFIAEELATIDPRLVHYGYQDDSWEEFEVKTEEGTTLERKLKPDAKLVPDGVAYDRFVVHLLALVKDLSARIEVLEKQASA